MAQSEPRPGRCARSVMVHLMGIMKSISFSLLILFMTLLSSCSTVISSLYGIKPCETRSIDEIEKYAQKYDIPLKNLYLLDTSYISFINNIDSAHWLLAKNHFQPLQALYFNNSGELVSFYNNCNAGGFPNLKWNRAGSLETFVPKTQIECDSILNFEKQLQYLMSIKGGKLALSNYSSANYNVVVYWNISFGRQSKRFIKQIKENCERAENVTVNIFFANDDEFFVLFSN